MKTLVKVAAGIAGLYLLLMLGAGLVAKTMLSGSQIQGLVSSLASDLPVKVSAGEGDFDLAEWFFFRPAVTIQNLTIGNPEGFSERPLLAAKAVSAQVALLSLFQDRIDVRSFKLQEPKLSIERDAQGRTNVEALLDGLSKGQKPETSSEPPSEGGAALSIESLLLDSGTIEYFGPGQSAPAVRLHDIDLSLSNFSAGRTCQISLDAKWFDGSSSTLEFDGNAGPFSAKSTPAKGALSIVLALAEMPASLRQEYFGDLLAAPETSRLSLKTEMQGDLLGKLEGKGNLVVSDLQIGQNAQNRLPLAGDVPLDLSVDKPFSDPAFTLRTEGASLQLGKGAWQGQANLQFANSRLRGGSRGSIKGVRVEEMLAAFASTQNTIFGAAEIPSYEIEFAGSDAAQIRDSLKGRGDMRLDEGRVALFDLLDTIERHMKKLMTGEAAAAGQTDFSRFVSHIEIADQQIQMTGMALENARSQISGQGVIGLRNQALRFDLVTAITGQLAATLGGRTDSTGQARLNVPVQVTGTVESPKVRPDVGRLVKEQAVEKAKGILDSIFKRPK